MSILRDQSHRRPSRARQGGELNAIIIVAMCIGIPVAGIGCGGRGGDERADQGGAERELAWTGRAGAPATVADVNVAQAPPPNPHRYESPFRNARPDAAYTGDATCALCHKEIVDSFAGHGMARSFALADRADVRGDWGGRGAVHHDPSGYTYTMLLRDGRHTIVESRADDAGREIHRVEKEVDAVIGSGDTDQGFLYEESGGWYLLPIEWYAKKKIWDMAPGFDGADQERWTRRLLPGCLGCHASHPAYIAESGNRYAEPMPAAIGCERCHGPGALHADARMSGGSGVRADGLDSTIVNPARLERARQLDVCAQCHLQGDVRRPRPGCGDFDFRPALRLDDFRITHVPVREDTLAFGFVRHMERLVQSRCFRESDSMTCTTCHNPHETSRGREAAHWIEKCLGCHAASDCPETAHGGLSMSGDCVGCHMRRSEPYDLRHVTITDHWIRRTVEPPSSFAVTRTIARDDVPLARFDGLGAVADTSPHDVAELGMSHVAIRQDRTGVALLERATTEGVKRAEAFLQLAIGLRSLGRRDEALAALDEAARCGPESAEGAFRLGQTALAAGRSAQAASAFRAGLAVYAEDPLAWANLAIALGASDSLESALDAAQRAVALHPGSDAAQRVLGRTLVALGRAQEAEAPLREALRLSPDDYETWMTLGDLYGRASRFRDALGAFERASRLAPAEVAPIGNMALALTELGETDRARALLDSVLAREPQNARARALLSRIDEMDAARAPAAGGHGRGAAEER